MTKLAPEWVRNSDPVIRSPARYRWTTAPALESPEEGDYCIHGIAQGSRGGERVRGGGGEVGITLYMA